MKRLREQTATASLPVIMATAKGTEYDSTIGLWAAPDPEELEQEYLAYYKAMQKRRKKTA